MKGSNSDSGLTTKWSNRLLVVGLTAILMAVLFTGCRPKGILSSREMRKVLVDLHKTDALINITGLQYGHDEAQNIYYAQVLEKHGITLAQFASSIVWYTAHPVFFDKIYPKVQADLKAEHDAFLEQYADELKLTPQQNDTDVPAAPQAMTLNRLDSLIWVNRHGYPSTWSPWVPPYRLLR